MKKSDRVPATKVSGLLSMVLLGLALLACGGSSGSGFEDCRYGRPEAIFNPDLPPIRSHRFFLEGKQGIEEVQFQNGTELTIVQSGCEAITQDFTFELPRQQAGTLDSAWVDRAAAQFRFLASLGPEYMAFSEWARAMQARREAFKPAARTEIQPGFFVRIDPITAADRTLLRITLSENP